MNPERSQRVYTIFEAALPTDASVNNGANFSRRIRNGERGRRFLQRGRAVIAVSPGLTARAMACRTHFKKRVLTPGPFRHSFALDRTPRWLPSMAVCRQSAMTPALDAS